MLVTLQQGAHKMNKASSLAAYIAWVVALVAILTPPTMASVGISAIANAQQAVFALVEDQPDPLTIADLRAAEPGWQA
jgi:hypothetical protein